MKLKKSLFVFLILFGILLNIKPSLAKEVRKSLGLCLISAYCPETNDPAWSRETSTGKVATSERTIAVDMNDPLCSYGAILEINGERYTVEDCGNLKKYGRDLDIFVDTKSETLEWGVKWCEVYLIQEKKPEEIFIISKETQEEMKKAYKEYLRTTKDEMCTEG